MVCSTRGRHFFKDPLEENTQRAMFEQFSTRQVAISFWFADWLRESREFSGPVIELLENKSQLTYEPIVL